MKRFTEEPPAWFWLSVAIIAALVFYWIQHCVGSVVYRATLHVTCLERLP